MRLWCNRNSYYKSDFWIGGEAAHKVVVCITRMQSILLFLLVEKMYRGKAKYRDFNKRANEQIKMFKKKQSKYKARVHNAMESI